MKNNERIQRFVEKYSKPSEFFRFEEQDQGQEAMVKMNKMNQLNLSNKKNLVSPNEFIWFI